MVKMNWFLVLVRLERRFIEFRQATLVDIRECRKQRVKRWNQWRESKQNGFTFHPEQSANDTPIESWIVAHNAELDTLASEQSANWRESRIEGIRHVQSVRKLERAIAKYHRRTSTPIETPVSTLASHPLPAVNLQGDDTTESEIQELLATIRDGDRRADVRAECWIVRSAHPSAPAKHVFNRALKTCQMVSRGVYSEKERSRQRTYGIPNSSVGEPMHSKAVAYWEASLEECNRQERMELAMTIAKSKLGETLLQEMLSGKSKQEIADSMGVSLPTLYRRLTALDVFKPDSVQWSMERNSVFVRTA